MVFVGALDCIPVGSVHLFVDTAGGVFGSPSAVHPGQAPHVERGAVAKRFWSPVRIHQARAKSARLGVAVATIAPPELRSLLVEPADLAAAGLSHRPTGARAPPLA
jgi:hypothetical protein